MVLAYGHQKTCRLVGVVRKFNDNGVMRSLST